MKELLLFILLSSILLFGQRGEKGISGSGISLGTPGMSKIRNTVSVYVPKVYYVDRDAAGTGSGSSWANASTSVAGLNWSNIVGGDTVYVSGGTDSVTYGRTQLSGIVGNTGIIVITKGKDTGHNGKVIFLAQDTLHNYTFQFTSNCSNIKITGLTFKWNGIISGNNEQVISIASSSYIYIDSCHIISNGKVEGIIPSATSFISITNNLIESLANNYPQEQDGIEFAGGGGGGHTITGNTIVLRGTNATPHKDIMQIGGVEGLMNGRLTTIANNFMIYNAEGVVEAGGVYIANIGSNQFLVYNNIITVNTYSGTHCFEIDNSDQPTHTNSLKFYNNTLITGGIDDRALVLGTVDTVDARNNIFMNDSLGMDGLFLLGYNTVPHLTFDYNQYFQRGRSIKIDTNANGTNSITWAQWRLLGGYDAHSDTGVVNFANIWGTNASDYKLVNNSSGIDGGTNLSAYFTTDILGATRTGTWDRGVHDTTLDVTAPSAPTSLSAVGSTTNIVLTWVDPTALDLAKIYVYRALTTNPTVLIDSVNPGVQTYTDANVSGGLIYFYRLEARDGTYNVSGYSGNASDTCNTVPSAPLISGLTATGNFSISGVALTPLIALTWAQPSGDSTYIYRSATNDTTTASKIKTVANATVSNTDSVGLTLSTTYYYWVKNKQGTNVSYFSTVASDTATVLGTELITTTADRDFSSNTGFWTMETGWAIGSGTANYTNTSSYNALKHYNLVNGGSTYQVTFTVTSITAGKVQYYMSATLGPEHTVTGTFHEYFTCDGTGTKTAGFQNASSTSTFSIDNVSIKKVTP